MLQRAIAGVIVARLVLAPWAAADEPSPGAGAIAASAAREARRPAEPAKTAAKGPMPKGLKWTGAALMMAGGATLFHTALGNCGGSCGDRAVGFGVGGAEFAVGSFLIGLAEARRSDAQPADPAPSLRDAAIREAARQTLPTSRRGPMPGGLKWTGIGLLIGSGLPVFIAKFSDCISDEFSCRDQRHAAYAVAGVMAGTGAGLLAIANAKRSPALPSLVLGDGRAVLQQRISF